jgi:putative RecB family exonuclease
MPSISPSAISLFKQCSLKFRLKYIDKMPEKVGIEAYRGSITHKVLEILFSIPPANRNLDFALNSIDKAVHSIFKNNKSTNNITDKDLEIVKNLIHNYFKLENPKKVPVKNTEQFVSAKLTDNLKLIGFADRIDLSPVSKLTRIVDYKTGKLPPLPFRESVIFQLNSYALALYESTKELPARIQGIFLGNPSGIVKVDPTINSIKKVQQIYINTWSDIKYLAQNNQWQPNQTALCAWCSYQKLCPKFKGMPPEYPQKNAEEYIS